MKVEKTAARVWGVLLVLAVSAATVTACGNKPAPARASQGQGRAVTVTRVESRPLENGLIASGVLVSREEAAVGSDIAGYRVDKVNVEQGAWVKRGQPLAVLDDSLLRAQIDQARAQAKLAADQAKNVAGLDDQGVLSTEQIETRRIQAQVAEAQLEDLTTRKSHMVVRAPVAGLILTRNVRPGDISSIGGATPMFTMARDGLIELNADLSQEDMATVHVGDPVQVSLPDGQTVTGQVRLIDPQIDLQTKLGHVRVRLPVRPDIRPGGFARATFLGTSVAARVVPEKAVRYDADGASVVVVGADNRVRQVSVKTGRRYGGFVELLDGPPAGSRILARAAAFVLPGDMVQPTEEQASSAPPAPAAKAGAR